MEVRSRSAESRVFALSGSARAASSAILGTAGDRTSRVESALHRSFGGWRPSKATETRLFLHASSSSVYPWNPTPTFTTQFSAEQHGTSPPYNPPRTRADENHLRPVQLHIHGSSAR